MSAASLRRLVPVGWKGGIRELVDRLAARHVFEATDAQREDIARRAEALLAASVPDDAEARGLTFDLLASQDWKARAEAAARLSASGAWTPSSVVGSLAPPASGPSLPWDDARLAQAIAVAARETLLPGLPEAQERLRGPAGAALAHERDGASHWDVAARPLLTAFAANARASGADRRTAALRALAAAAHLKGAALSAASDEPFLLGAAAAALLVRKGRALADGAPSAQEELVREIATLNGARTALWDGVDPETARRMGAAAALAAFGRGTVAAPSAHPHAAPRAAAHVPTDVLARLGAMTASDAAAALDDEAADPRLDLVRRRRLETLADALRRHRAAHAVSCAEALGEDAPEPEAAEMRPGMPLYRLAQRGRAVVCEGKGGRAVRCRPVAGPGGARLGHLAFDALSREFGGRPLYAVYALSGARYGYAWADEARPLHRRGAPEQGFVTAPASIPL